MDSMRETASNNSLCDKNRESYRLDSLGEE